MGRCAFARIRGHRATAGSVRGRAEVQISTPAISLVRSEVIVHVYVRANYLPDHGTTPLPEPIHGEIRISYQLVPKTVNGKNVLAVEIHQSGTNSSDIAFDLALQAERLQPPRLGIALASDEVQLYWPGYAEGLNLYSATNLIPPITWDPVTDSPSLNKGLRTLMLPVVPNGARFYRLQAP